MNKPEFVTSREICEIMGFKKRTLHRRLLSSKNPLIPPAIKRIGAMSLWDAQEFYDWVEREKIRTQLELSQNNLGDDYGE